MDRETWGGILGVGTERVKASQVGDSAGEPAFILILLEGKEPKREEEAWHEKRLCGAAHKLTF